MAISKLLGFIPRVASECKFMSKKKVMDTCIKVGEDLSKIAKENGGRIPVEQLNPTCANRIPKIKKFKITTDRSEFGDFLCKTPIGEIGRQYANVATAMTAKNIKGETLLFTPIQEYTAEKGINATVHELEHSLNSNVTLNGKIQKQILKIYDKIQTKYGHPETSATNGTTSLKDKLKLMVQNGLKKHSEKLNQKAKIVQNKYFSLTNNLILDKLHLDPCSGTLLNSADKDGLLKYLNLSSSKRLDADLRSTVRRLLSPRQEKQNIFVLKALKNLFKDETRAYKVGGISTRNYLGLKEGSTTSEMTSRLYEETCNALKQELKNQRIKRIKRMFGLKVRNYEGITSRPINFNAKKVDSSELPSDIFAKHKKQS